MSYDNGYEQRRPTSSTCRAELLRLNHPPAEAATDVIEQCARIAETVPLESYCTHSHKAQSADHRKVIAAAIRAALSGRKELNKEPKPKCATCKQEVRCG